MSLCSHNACLPVPCLNSLPRLHNPVIVCPSDDPQKHICFQLIVINLLVPSKRMHLLQNSTPFPASTCHTLHVTHPYSKPNLPISSNLLQSRSLACKLLQTFRIFDQNTPGATLSCPCCGSIPLFTPCLSSTRTGDPLLPFCHKTTLHLSPLLAHHPHLRSSCPPFPNQRQHSSSL